VLGHPVQRAVAGFQQALRTCQPLFQQPLVEGSAGGGADMAGEGASASASAQAMQRQATLLSEAVAAFVVARPAVVRGLRPAVA